MINEVDLLTINIHLMQNLIHIGLFHVPSHMILAYEHIIQRCSSLRVSSLEQIFLKMDHEALRHEYRLI